MTATTAAEFTAWATVVLAAITAVYVIVTWRLMVHARRSAAAAQLGLALQRRPVLVDAQQANTEVADTSNVTVEVGGVEALVVVGLRNVGGGPAVLHDARLLARSASVEGRPSRSIVAAGETCLILASVQRADLDWEVVSEALRDNEDIVMAVSYADLAEAQNLHTMVTIGVDAGARVVTAVSYEEAAQSL